ncbi:hypothetical protein [Streptacidiphilus sp. EB129]|uniref:hypothetical protein n=1 Tax=Streptacidiphilus sp. EB129 TaxID=3156262 RepID=UPI00351822B4
MSGYEHDGRQSEGHQLHQQELLRSGLRALADRQEQVSVPIGAVLAEGRRQRRIRVFGLAAAVAACTLAAGLLTHPLSTPSARTAPAVAATASTRPSAAATTPRAAATTPAAAALAKRQLDPAGPPAPPAAVRQGQAYAFDWNLQCGTPFLVFAGRTWDLVAPLHLPAGLHGRHGVRSGPPELPGYVTVTGPGSARFDAPGYLAQPVLLRAAPAARSCV